MPKKRKSGGGASGRSGRKGKAKRASARKERKSGLYLSPGDADYKQLSEQLSREGLALRDVPGDGNCLFRAFAEQLQDNHGNLRRTVVQHMRANRADYAPFVDDVTSFDSYMEELGRDGTYAGNDVIVAVSRCYGVHVVIHQLDTPHWEVQAPSTQEGWEDKTLHVAYLRGEHYCSVRPLLPGHSLPPLEAIGRDVPSNPATSSSSFPPLARTYLTHESCSSTSPSPPGTPTAPPSLNDPLCDRHGDPLGLSVQELLEAASCEDQVLAEQILRDNGGNVDLALVELLQIMALSEHSETTQVVGGEGGNCQRQAWDTSTSQECERNPRHLREKKESKRQRGAVERKKPKEKEQVGSKLI